MSKPAFQVVPIVVAALAGALILSLLIEMFDSGEGDKRGDPGMYALFGAATGIVVQVVERLTGAS